MRQLMDGRTFPEPRNKYDPDMDYIRPRSARGDLVQDYYFPDGHTFMGLDTQREAAGDCPSWATYCAKEAGIPVQHIAAPLQRRSSAEASNTSDTKASPEVMPCKARPPCFGPAKAPGLPPPPPKAKPTSASAKAEATRVCFGCRAKKKNQPTPGPTNSLNTPFLNRIIDLGKTAPAPRRN